VVKLDRLLRGMHFAGEEAELVIAHDYYEPPSEPEGEGHMGDMSAAYAHAAYVAEVEVDTLTGAVRVLRMTVVQDVGRVVNGMGIEGQIEGGAAQGLGYALSEEMKIENGIVLNPNFRDYKVPTAPEMPEFEFHFIENDDAEGPYGAKGIAEIPICVPAPAVANAVYNAIGIRFDAPPITPEKIYQALHGRKEEK